MATPPNHPLRYLPLVGVTALLLVGALLPASTMAELRAAWPGFSHSLSWLERTLPGVDSLHVYLFAMAAWVGVISLRSLPAPRRLAWLLAGLVLLAGLTELVQFGVPGRNPRWTDFRDDLVGGVAGLLVGMACLALFRRRQP